MSKADDLFAWWRALPPGLRPNPFRYSERDDVELAQFQSTLSEKLAVLQTTIERPFKDERENLRKALREAYLRVAEWLDQAKARFNTAHVESEFFAPQGTLRLTWRPILPNILNWLDGIKAFVIETAKEPTRRPFLALVGADPECLDVPDFHPVCGFWSDNYLIGPFPWHALNWDAVIGPERFDVSPFTPQRIAASLAHSVWIDLLADITAEVRKGHKAVKDCPWTVAHALCELARPDKGRDDTFQASIDRVCWATSLHVPFRRWLHSEAAKNGVSTPVERTNCYPTWMGFASIIGDDPTGMIGGPTGHRRACFFAFLLDELSTLWNRRKAEDAEARDYKKPWHGEAIAFLKRNPNASAADVARAVGVDRSTVSRDETIGVLLPGRRDRQKGYTDGKGHADGIVDPDALED
ncbi:MAG: MarR family transcriptional regulator [Planctomycetes bacterium]|nr:MarR family transcriptional regulator [Planctomycetota bacterium]